MSGHDFTTCDCAECRAALLELQDELDELERCDPAVKAVAESYDRMVERITDHRYRPDHQGQWFTGRCDKCGEPKSAHLRCTCHVHSDAIGPHTRGCPNHPEAPA